jgi:hypothetical protein
MTPEKFITEIGDAERTGEVIEYLHEREKQLTASTRPIIFAMGQRVTYDYIHPESTVKASAFSKGFCMDDASAHETFARAALDMVKVPALVSTDKVVIMASQLAVMQYMGAGSTDERYRNKLLGGIFRGNRRSIAEMAASGVSMCMERAAVTHNMCILAGVPSMLITGTAKLEDEKKDSGHAFQIVRIDDTNHLFDSTNPSLSLINDELRVAPSHTPIDALEFLLGASKKIIVVSHASNSVNTKRDIQYSHNPEYPATFEGFDALRFSERDMIGGMSSAQYQTLAIEDNVRQFADSDFAADYLKAD